MSYTYDGIENLTAGEVFYWVMVDETLEQLGVTDLVAGAMVVAGQPIITTRSKFGGATRGTSAASIAMRRLVGIEMRTRLPTITGASFATLRITLTRNLGAFVGRTIPVVGWSILAYDLEEISRHTVTRYNNIVDQRDRIAL